MYEDYYEDYSDFDQMVDQFKDSLKNAVKEEHQSEIERLRKENRELQEVKKNLDEMRREHSGKMNELRAAVKNAENKVKRARLSEIFEACPITLYEARNTGEQKPKCDDCDDKRLIHYKSPKGKEVSEYCDCNSLVYSYKPSELKINELKISSNSGEPLAWYHLRKDDQYGDCAKSFLDKGDMFNGEPFESLKIYDTKFRNVEDCQSFCDYLNEKKKSESEDKAREAAPKVTD